MRILVADDDAGSRLIATMALRQLGHECRVVSDGAEAWEAFQADRPDVIISDWMMPGLSGLQLCRDVRADALGASTYFIMLTSHEARDQIVEGMTAGADDYLVKPLDPDELGIRLIAASRVTHLHSRLTEQQTELERLNLELTAISLRDPLTGLGNRRALEEDLQLLEARSSRYESGYSLALLDVDHFKAYNDTHGHQAGDDVLQAVAGELKAQARSGDILYRYGGEEFLCVFPQGSLDGTIVAVQRMRSGLERLAIQRDHDSADVLTLSAGLAVLEPGDPRPVHAVLKAADDALYRAKQLGRNRVEHTSSAAVDAAHA